VTELGGPFPKSIALSDADLLNLYRLAEGALSPLTGPMTASEWNRVLEDKVVIRYGKKFAWTVPIAFPVTDEEAAAITIGETVALTHDGKPVGRLEVHDIYARPGGKMVLDDPRTKLAGGEVWALPQPKNPGV
jgi:sulfate adenylyltransferase